MKGRDRFMNGLCSCPSCLSLGAPIDEKGEVDVSSCGRRNRRFPERFRLEPAVFSYELEPVMSTPRYTVSKLRFPSPIETPDVENNMVHAEYFAPGGLRPEAARSHRLAHSGSGFSACRVTWRRGWPIAGVAALFVKLPYYGERRPGGRGTALRSGFCRRTSSGSMTAMRQAVCDVRRAAVWLAARPDVDRQRLGVSGISLGGIVSSLAAAVDPAIREGAFLLAGGDLATILWEMPEGAAYRKQWIEVRPHQTRPEDTDRPIRSIDLCGRPEGQAPHDDRGQGRRGRSARLDVAALGGRRPAADPLVRLRPLLGGRLSFARHPPNCGFLRGPVRLAIRGFDCQKSRFGLISRSCTSFRSSEVVEMRGGRNGGPCHERLPVRQGRSPVARVLQRGRRGRDRSGPRRRRGRHHTAWPSCGSATSP